MTFILVSAEVKLSGYSQGSLLARALKRSDPLSLAKILPIISHISETVQGGKLVLITNRKSHMSFRLLPKSETLNDLERRNGYYFALIRRIR